MFDEKPIESAAKGATKALLEWTEEKVLQLIIKFKNRDIAFVEDPETITAVKEQRKTPEWEYFKQNVENPDLRILFQMGFEKAGKGY
ncbi:MAG: hypothetical protein QW835_03740 [Candidatus Hadarchaeum sp.]